MRGSEVDIRGQSEGQAGSGEQKGFAYRMHPDVAVAPAKARMIVTPG